MLVKCFFFLQSNETEKVNFFAASADNGESDDESDLGERVVERQPPMPTETAKRLPNPLSGVADDDEEDIRSSVFVNYYHRAEQAKLAVLEQHVKLTAASEARTDDGGNRKTGKKKRQVCVNFQRGSCRYGLKCKFAHSTDAASEAADTAEVQSQSGSAAGNKLNSFAAGFHEQPSIGEYGESDDDDDDSGNKKRKVRSGVTDSLMPPKKARQSHDKQRRLERPWTVEPK